jgi:regulatory protein
MTDRERCYAAAMRILRIRFNSAAELRRKLLARDFERDVIDDTLKRLTDEKWLDDARFAGAFVRTRLAKRIGRLRIRRELINAGVADDIIDDAIRANVDGADERERALASGLKRLPRLARRPDVRNKLTAYLLKQGYDGALVRDVVKEILVAHH